MTDASIRLFAHPLLERLTHVRPTTVALVWGAILGLLLGRATTDRAFAPLPDLGWVPLGVLAWTLLEYALHRWLFHWRPRAAPLRRVVFLLHGIHHAQPDDGSRVVMPPVVSLPVAAALWGLVALVLEEPARDLFMFGLLAGYLAYDLIHWACHQTKPRTRWGRRLRRHHLRHHHVAADANFGVSSPLWDRVFGTGLGH